MLALRKCGVAIGIRVRFHLDFAVFVVVVLEGCAIDRLWILHAMESKDDSLNNSRARTVGATSTCSLRVESRTCFDLLRFFSLEG